MMMDPLLYVVRAAVMRLRDPGGQTMAEYGMLIGVIALVVLVAVLLLGGQISGALHTAATSA